jgi:hypothetical protein
MVLWNTDGADWAPARACLPAGRDFIFSFLLGFLCFRSLAANCFPIVSSLSYFLVKSLFYFFIRPDSYRDPSHRVRLLTDLRHPCLRQAGVFYIGARCFWNADERGFF